MTSKEALEKIKRGINMRLTQKSDYVLEHYEPNSTLYCILTKLGQLEDIEDELGIELTTLISILKANKVYLKGSFMNWDNGNVSNEIKEYKLDHDKIYIRYAHNYFELITHWEGHRLDIKDYGKTWALTKEELL